ncbi:MAG: aldo/keto reductase [Rhodospirillaceae bacterium]|jgi:aryl-alcohol dehydrogenase-like predicted oxidoreductase|nr:aldo/keto reductase [Rhodospirillaceae bacterium]MBT6430646.1 aldo/keto reductase [Rhodospirillaceae bacterium]MBT7759213.1 aldo/keto reductase [Rhodospirillaceae bacterium]
MDLGHLGPLGPVSRLTLGGGGLGQLWGQTDRAECVATLRAAVDGGIDLIDLAYRYGNGEAELVLGEAFEGRLPGGVRVTSKCLLGNTPAAEIEDRLRQSVHDSLARMQLERLDLFFLHSNVAPDGHPMQQHPDAGARMTAYSDFVATARPCFESLVAEGLIGAWGLTGIGHPDAIIRLLGERPAPSVVQCIANAMDSPGALKFYDEPARPRAVIAAAQANHVGVMGIRAVQAGALTDAIDRDLPDDHAEVRDFNAAGAYRALAAELGMSAAVLGHRYALSMDGVDTVVLGVKNRAELADCIAAADAGPLPAEIVNRVDGCFPDRDA